ncbi:hypothetical protein TL16_g04239 [Triparma laevis f. inornata]|uniref:t-SNARE coiled-coil homology domain-containing protein n=2 Tax=Triparma laevis TaxID=1534972 RepID=A0A9W7DRL9_9STRA|nr:hypothetical protein TrLO_g986 [Triparma laevis f. longispina]GMH65604.1 hypothetical protein TL16_g04239 [Triparma laevis f. inornata]
MIDRLPELLALNPQSSRQAAYASSLQTQSQCPLDTFPLLHTSPTTNLPTKTISRSSYFTLTSQISSSITSTYLHSLSSPTSTTSSQFMTFISSTLNLISQLKPEQSSDELGEIERNIKSMLMEQIKGVSEIYNGRTQNQKRDFEEERVRGVELLGVEELSGEEVRELEEFEEFLHGGGTEDLLEFGNGRVDDENYDVDAEQTQQRSNPNPNPMSTNTKRTPNQQPSITSISTSHTATNDDNNDAPASLALEGSLLLSNLQSTLDAAESLETQMSTITQLLTSFTDIVSTQSEQIQGIEKDAKTAVESVGKGEKELEKAKERLAAARSGATSSEFSISGCK